MTTLLVAVLVLVGAEAGTRAVESRIPSPARWGDLGTDLRFAQMEALSSEEGVDVVFLGSSMVEVGIDPEAFLAQSEWAESAFNASLSAGSARLLEAWATEVVFPLLEPRVVVIGMSSRELNDNGTNQQLVYDRYVESIGRADYLEKTTVAQTLELAANRYSVLYRLRDRIKLPHSFIRHLRSGEVDGFGITELGYNTYRAEGEYLVSDGFRERTTSLALNDYAIGGEELRALKRIVQAATSQGAKVYLINMPVLEADYLPMHPHGSQDYQDYMTTFADFGADDRVWADSARIVAQDSALFADPVHLNAQGVAVLVSWVADVVQEP